MEKKIEVEKILQYTWICPECGFENESFVRPYIHGAICEHCLSEFLDEDFEEVE